MRTLVMKKVHTTYFDEMDLNGKSFETKPEKN